MWDSFKPKSTTRYVNDVKSLPFDDLEEATTKDYGPQVEDFVQKYGLKQKSWVYPQVLAEVASWSYSRRGDKIDTKEFLAKNCKQSARNKGIYWFLMWDRRALDKQYVHTEFCALTPLILAAFKKMHGIKYSEWMDPHLVINPQLYGAITVDYPEYTTSELLEFRHQGLSVQTGKRAGVIKSAPVTYNLYGYPNELEDGRPHLGVLPQLTRMMLCQTWCAHPKHRSKYSILDPKSWDTVPPALIDESPISTPPLEQQDTPW
jgi:hypothetical protein